MKKIKVIIFAIVTFLLIVGIMYSGVDAYKRLPLQKEVINESLGDNGIIFNNDNNLSDVSGDDIITVPSGYAVVEDGHIVDFVFE